MMMMNDHVLETMIHLRRFATTAGLYDFVGPPISEGLASLFIQPMYLSTVTAQQAAAP